MYHLVYKIVLVTFFLTNISAEITQAQLDKYMEVSRSGAFLKYLQDDMLLTILTISNLDLNTTNDSMLELIRKKLNSKRYTSKYTENFKKFKSSDYEKIILFYNTSAGKKYAKSIQDNFNINKSLSRNILRKKFKKYLLRHPFSDEKTSLIYKFMNNLNIPDINIKTTEEFEIYKQNTLPLLYNRPKIKSIKSIKLEIKEAYKSMSMWDEETQMIFFQNFSEDELKEIVRYSSTEIGKIEYRLMMNARNLYYMGVINDIMKNVYNIKGGFWEIK